MDAVKKILELVRSEEGAAVIHFLMSEFKLGLTYLSAIRNDQLTVEEAMDYFDRSRARFIDVNKKLDEALALRQGL